MTNGRRATVGPRPNKRWPFSITRPGGGVRPATSRRRFFLGLGGTGLHETAAAMARARDVHMQPAGGQGGCILPGRLASRHAPCAAVRPCMCRLEFRPRGNKKGTCEEGRSQEGEGPCSIYVAWRYADDIPKRLRSAELYNGSELHFQPLSVVAWTSTEH